MPCGCKGSKPDPNIEYVAINRRTKQEEAFPTKPKATAYAVSQGGGYTVIARRKAK